MSKTRLHRAWSHMRGRCSGHGENAKTYYVDRGITICPEWDSFIAFRDWALAIGTYETQLEAARVYDAKAREAFGEFAHLNFAPARRA